MSNATIGSTVLQSSQGLGQLTDFTNMFGYATRTISELIGSNKALSNVELDRKYPLAREYMRNIGDLTNYIKHIGGETSMDSFLCRVQHVQAMTNFIDISNRMQFIKVLEDMLTIYDADNVGWGFIKVVPIYDNGVLINTDVYINDNKVDLTNPVTIQAIDWNGELVDGIELVDLNAGQTQRVVKRDASSKIVMGDDSKPIYVTKNKPLNLSILISKDSKDNDKYIRMLEDRDGIINAKDVRKALQFSPLSFMVVRISDPEQEYEDGVVVNSYETPIFQHIDFCHDIPTNEYISTLEKYNDLKTLDKIHNSREYAALNLFRWGILDLDTWNRGLSIYKATLNSPLLPDQSGTGGNDTKLDALFVNWVMERYNEGINSLDTSQELTPSDIVFPGSSISKIANIASGAFFQARALVVSNVGEDDLELVETYILFKSKKEKITRFNSMSRLNTSLYKIIETTREGEFIRVLNPIDVFCFVGYDMRTTIVNLASESANGIVANMSEEQIAERKQLVDYYNRISDFETPLE